MAVQIQIRRGSAAQWAAANPILAEGELAVELDTEKFKIGNGINHWLDLPYATGIPGPTGAQGPTGPAGLNGTTINKLGDIPDVAVSNALDGNVLMYQGSTSLWRASDIPPQNMDGGQF